MELQKKAVAFGKRFKLDSHHGIERFGIFFGIFVVAGVLVVGGSAAAALRSGSDSLSQTSLYTTDFTTSKTNLDGSVDGVYTDSTKDRALVVMHFDPQAQISYDAADYKAFLLGSDPDLDTEDVTTPGLTGQFYVFGSTGYVGVLLHANRSFDQQVLNLTMRANAELTYQDGDNAAEADRLPTDDKTFARYDQWSVFFNPGATETRHIAALDAADFDPARAYYDIVLKGQERSARSALNSKLQEMRTDLTQISSYTKDLQTTKVDGVFLKPPEVPKAIAGDKITGDTAAESRTGSSTLALRTHYTVPGGVNLNWRSGDVYDGYLKVLVPTGETYSQYLDKLNGQDSDGTEQQVQQMQWELSDGSSLTDDYQSSDTTVQPLTNLMNKLSQSYQNYAMHKAEYQSDLMLTLLGLDVDLRDVQSNSTVRTDKRFLTTLY